MSVFSAARARLHLLFARRAAESRMDEEVSFHLQMETERLVREERLPPNEARRRALATFGGVTQHTEALREGRGLAWLGGLSLDMKLGGRMLVKYPGLTFIGGLAMAFAICIGAVVFELVGLFMFPSLPLPNGDRIVQIRNWDIESSESESRALHDFGVWRDALSSVTDMGVYLDETRNLIGADSSAHRVAIAVTTASAFRVASGTPLLGRMLVESDEAPGAPPVIVLGYDLWQARFAGDSSLVGRSVRMDESYATVVGVMRDGYAFPVSHEAWVPLRSNVMSVAPREGPAVTIFGRLESGASLEDAEAQLALIGQRAATDSPNTHKRLQPQAVPFTWVYFDPSQNESTLLASFNLFAVLLLGLLSSNVALLLFARAATRETELIVRSALGARRKRIVAQLVAEALVLGLVAAAVGLGAAAFGLHQWGREFLEINMGVLPFWFEIGVSPATVLYALGLTVFGAVIAGAVPALKITRGLGARLREGTAGGGGVRFGGVWTAVIVTQVAVTVAFPAVVFVEQREMRRIQSFDVGFAAGQYLGVRLEMDSLGSTQGDSAGRRARFAAALETLRQRVAAEPGVVGVTFADRLPRMEHPVRYIELDGDDPTRAAIRSRTRGPSLALREVDLNAVDPSYFAVLGAPIIAGRGFNAADFAAGVAVIVDQGFVDQVLLGRNPIGQRLRFLPRQRNGEDVDESRPWYEIVGVVKDLGMNHAVRRQRAAGLYYPAVLGNVSPVNMVVHARGDPLTLAPEVRVIATSVDARLRLSTFQRLDQVADESLWFIGLWLRATVVLMGIALLLSLAGIFAVLSFTVSRRTREIGVRVALGASRRLVVAAIFRRPLTQVAMGIAAGGLLVGAMAHRYVRGVVDGVATFEQGLTVGQIALLIAYAVFMFGVCLLACVVPTRRALRVEPTQALRAE